MPATWAGHPGRPLVTRGSTAHSPSRIPLSAVSYSLSVCLLESSRLLFFFSFSFGSAIADLSVSGAVMLLTNFLLCHHCLSVGEVREIAVRKEQRERDRDCLLPVISSRLRLVSEGYNPDHHLSLSSSPRRGSAAARRPILVW
ncbi:hypothetical protein M9H77_36515 [Catharanthus roseus]|uniref:Uncharacterized protein n=1 Tax=Catharanthus roseus TaxID=4058 RepID=A0ACB9ZSE9_CATRO|nr:hypothetical protein M9H77_36515 [Catharanthus roseus]